jgi:hypothetical protein
VDLAVLLLLDIQVHGEMEVEGVVVLHLTVDGGLWLHLQQLLPLQQLEGEGVLLLAPRALVQE